MRDRNKMPHGNHPNKRGLKANYIYHISADIDAKTMKWIESKVKELNVSKAEIVRQCINKSATLEKLMGGKSNG